MAQKYSLKKLQNLKKDNNNFSKIVNKLFIAVIFTGFINSCGINEKVDMSKDNDFRELLKNTENKLSKAYTDYSEAYFNATISGKDEDYTKSANYEMVLNQLYSNKEIFNELKKYKDDGLITNDTLKRALEVLYNTYAAKQIDTNFLNQMTQKGSEIEKKFSTFRAKIGGASEKLVTDNEIEDILKNETNSTKLEEAWKAHKEIGNVVAKDVIALVKLRNKAAQELGFKNYQQMSLSLSEQDPDEIEKFFDDLDNLTRESFIELKDEIDNHLAKRYNIDKSKLMPWHYQNRFFQEAPEIYDIDLDHYFTNVNIEKKTIEYYDGIGTPIDDMTQKSDLYEKKGKYQHAYCIDIDRDKKDIRVVCNITPTQRWMETNLHEFGHAIYQKYVGETLPWTLKVPAHTFTTEGIAMLFGRFAMSAEWLSDMGILSKDEANKIASLTRKKLRLQQLVFSRWVQVVYRFEKEMYSNPDQDLNTLWWDLVEKYQMMKRPEGRNSPDWASKIHIASYPCYYHNYLLGEIFASQFYHYINDKIVKNPEGKYSSFVGNKKTAEFLVKNVFEPANMYNWKTMIKKATGEDFTPKYYAKEFGIK